MSGYRTMHDYDTPTKIDVGEIKSQKDLPVYTAFTTIEFMSPVVGREYEIGYWSYDGEERSFEKHFEATLVAARQYESFDEVENLTLAYATEEVSPDKAKSKIEKYIESSNNLLLLVFIRPGPAQNFVMNGELDI